LRQDIEDVTAGFTVHGDRLLVFAGIGGVAKQVDENLGQTLRIALDPVAGRAVILERLLAVIRVQQQQ